MSNIRMGVHCTSAKRKLKTENAITLVALVLTIIVLLILAGISLNLIMGDGGILNRTTNARKTTDLAGAQEKIDLLVAEASYDYMKQKYVEGNGTISQDKNTYILGQLGDILSTLKTDGDIDDFGTTEGSAITGISLGIDSLDLAVGDNQTITVSSVAGVGGDYYIEIENQRYLAHLENEKIEIDKEPIASGGPSFEISGVSSSNDSKVKAEKVGTNQVKVTAREKGSATITVSYGSINETFTVTVKGNVTVSTQVENITDSEVVGTATEISGTSYAEGSTINLTATVTNNNYQFKGWYESKDGGAETEKSTNASYTYTVPEDGTEAVVLKAKFEKKPQTLGTTASDSGVGYYIKKGNDYAIVFADVVAQAGTTSAGNTVTWSSTNSSTCTFPYLTEAQKAEYKTYVVNGEYTDPKTTANPNQGFGTHPLLVEAPNTSGKDRFYALALTDYPSDEATSKWYNVAGTTSPYMNDFNSTGGTDGKGSPTSKAFGKGKENTEKMLKKGIAGGYGALTNNDIWYKLMNGWTADMKTSWTANGYGATTSNDDWGSVKNGWFIPSFEEWSAFGYAMVNNKFRSNSYSTLGLSTYYWSSSQNTASSAWYASFCTGCMGSTIVNYDCRVRLSTTF